MRMKWLLPLLFLSSCTLYKSNMRRNFEAEGAPGRVKLQSLLGCEKVSTHRSDFESQSAQWEIIWSAADLEILEATSHEKTLVLTRSAQGDGTFECLYEYAPAEWELVRDSFLAERTGASTW
ncbi:MAG: hypothetical protein N2578_02240 [Bdellovibrionaceae bacterium]|nr:hypothetical protein [Pseudobdellovibrionaceae bacterium]